MALVSKHYICELSSPSGWALLLIANLVLQLAPCSSSTAQEARQKKPVKRAKRPTFEESEWKQIYFADIFRDGFVGPRPEPSQFIQGNVDGRNNPGQSSNVGATDANAWSQHISRESLEDEVKTIHLELQGVVRTPSGFSKNIAQSRQQFSMLSVLFGIVHEYDQDVRWKKYAAVAQPMFADVANKARTASGPTYELARRRHEDLGELIRGGSIQNTGSSKTTTVWSDVVSRRVAMNLLETKLEESLKPNTSSERDLKSNADDSNRHAQIIAALAKVLIQPGMDDADDDGYINFAKAMGFSASELSDAIRNGEFELATAAVEKIEQSCMDCHSEWR